MIDIRLDKNNYTKGRCAVALRGIEFYSVEKHDLIFTAKDEYVVEEVNETDGRRLIRVRASREESVLLAWDDSVVGVVAVEPTPYNEKVASEFNHKDRHDYRYVGVRPENVTRLAKKLLDKGMTKGEYSRLRGAENQTYEEFTKGQL